MPEMNNDEFNKNMDDLKEMAKQVCEAVKKSDNKEILTKMLGGDK
jgi:hypothetical protein